MSFASEYVKERKKLVGEKPIEKKSAIKPVVPGPTGIGFFKPPKATERIGNTSKGALKSAGAGFANAAGTIVGLYQNTLDREKAMGDYGLAKMREKEQDPGRRRKLEKFSEGEYSKMTKESKKYRQRRIDSIQGKADEWSRESAAHVDRAKQGLGGVGRFAVDAGVALGQLGGDLAIGALTHTGLAPMAVRGFGGAAQEARQGGASLDQQLKYGAGSAALSVATEKISSVPKIFKKVFGSGVADKAIEGAVKKMGGSVAGKLALSAISEGGEEFVEDVFQPILQRATWDPTARFNLSEALYDAAIGATLGGLGGSVDIAADAVANRSYASSKPITKSPVKSQEDSSAPKMANDTDDVKVTPAASQAAFKPEAVQQARPQDGPTPAAPVQAVPVTPVAPKAVNTSSVSAQFRDRLDQGERVPQQTFTPQQFQDMADSGDYSMDANFKVFKPKPEQHIDRRNAGDVGDRKINAFQFDHPELHDYFAGAASELLDEYVQAEKGGQIIQRGMYDYIRTKRAASPRIAAMLDEFGMSYADIDKALNAIIHDKGQENFAAAKRAELILDDMLSNGYESGAGFIPPNQDYLAAKAEIPGAYVPTESAQDLPFDDGLGAADRYSLNSDFDELQAQKSQFFPEGANAARPVDVPTTGFDGRNISKSAATVMGAKAIPNDVIPEIEQFIADGRASYRTLSDRRSQDRAESTIRSKGFEGALESFRRDVRMNKSGKDLVALGQRLMVNAAANNDGNTLAEIFQLYSALSVNQAQGMQAMSMLRKLSPESQLYAIQKAIDNINESDKIKKRFRGHSDSVPVNQWMQKTGEALAKRLEVATGAPTEKAQSVTQSILSDIYRYAKNGVDTVEQKTRNPRTEGDRLYDLLNNYGQYSEAWEAAKAKIIQEFGNDPDAISAFEQWLDQDAISAFFTDATGEAITIDPELMNKFLAQKNQDGRNAVMEDIYQNIADQLPATFAEKANAWRYMSMLLNPTTHIRNSMGNLIQAGARSIKNDVGAVLEPIFVRDKAERTKSFLTRTPADLARKDFAKSLYEEDIKSAMGEGKYQDGGSSGLMREIEERRQKQVFSQSWWGGRAAQAVSNFNTDMLELEDRWFNESAYVSSLAQALKAKGITAEEAKAGGPAVEAARAYAIEEAQRATYRNTTALSEALSRAGSYKGDNPVIKAASFGFNALIPFRKTPANVLTTSFDYSPVGILKAVGNGISQVIKGEYNAAQMVDSLAAGLTGTGILMLGMYLASEGILTAKVGDDDEKERKFLREIGKQDYSINIGGVSYSLDWAAPSAMPLLAGAAIIEGQKENSEIFPKIMDAINSSTQVIFETSMLSSMDDFLSGISYAENVAGYALNRITSSYLSQFAPTVGGKIAAATDSVVRKSYVEPGTGQTMKDISFFKQGLKKKIPGMRQELQPMIDRWGREVSTGTVGERVFQNFLSPGYMKTATDDAVDQELLRLNGATGNGAVFPAEAPKSIAYTKDGEKADKVLSAEEYTEFSRALGGVRREILEDAFNAPFYKAMSDVEKSEYVSKVYTYAKEQAEQDVGIDRGTKWVKNARNAEKDLGISTAEFIALTQKYGADQFSGKPYEKLKAAKAVGISAQKYFQFKTEAPSLDQTPYKYRGEWRHPSDKNISKKETYIWAKKNGLTREQADALCRSTNGSW